MCHLRVTAIVLYDGAMIRDNGAVSESKVSYVPWTHEFLLGASWYCGLRSWSIIALQLMCSLFVLPLSKFVLTLSLVKSILTPKAQMHIYLVSIKYAFQR
jgi:hypothetical protein